MDRKQNSNVFFVSKAYWIPASRLGEASGVAWVAGMTNSKDVLFTSVVIAMTAKEMPPATLPKYRL